MGVVDLPACVEHFAEELGSPSLVVCLDSGAGNYEQLWSSAGSSAPPCESTSSKKAFILVTRAASSPIITGVLGPQSNAHGPNEFLYIEYAKKLTACITHVLAKHYSRQGGDDTTYLVRTR